MTSCPHPGALRATLDGERTDLTAHIAGCSACAARVEDLEADARNAETAVAALGDGPAVDVEAALRSSRPAAPAAVTDLDARRRRTWSQRLVSRAAAAVLIVTTGALVVGTPAGRAAASAVLETFRSERLAVVTIDPEAADFSALAALSEVATVEGLDEGHEPRPVTSLTEAAAVAGFDVAPLDAAVLPPALAGAPVDVHASPPHEVRVSFDAAAAPELPPALDGVVLTVGVPGAVVQAVGDPSANAPGLLTATAGQLTIDVEGASLAEVRTALLSLPGLPPETVAQLETLERWDQTLPIPVPPGITWEDTTVAGHPGLAFGDNTGLGSALVWNTGEVIRAVVGTQPIDVLRSVAESGA